LTDVEVRTSFDSTPKRLVLPVRHTARKSESHVWRRLREGAAFLHLTGKRTLAALGLGVTLAGLYQFYSPIFTGPPARAQLSGDLNVGVAEFAAAAGTSDSYVRALSDSLYRAVKDQVRSLAQGRLPLDLQVAGSDKVGAIGGDTDADRVETAERVAREMNAHLLLFGVARTSADGVELRPQFVFAQQVSAHPEDRQEMFAMVGLPPSPSGTHSLGVIRESGSMAAGVTARARARERAAKRVRAFAAFIVGLSHYTKAIQDQARGAGGAAALRAAARWFRVAERTGWDPRAGHVLQLFLGNTALLNNDFENAQHRYRAALRYEPGYRRAELGLAEAMFHSVSSGCSPSGKTAQALGAPIRRYSAALSHASAAPSLLRSKAQFGLGRAALCLSLAAPTDRWSVAARHFRAIIGDYRGGFRAIRPQASGAFGGLGLIVILRGDTSRERLQGAATDFREAIDLTPRSPAQGALFSFLGYVQAQLEQRAASLAAYRRAIELDPANEVRYRRESQELLGR
jgi:tetratricopeptide (TPR) repeat protein